MASFTHAENINLSEEASVPFLKNVTVIKSLLAAKAGGDTRDNNDEEDEQYTIVNGGDPQVENLQLIPHNFLSGSL